ncbi:MAG: hypothetical protein M1828_006207 [Chrysothrix sp. TS-e1954]|nr:MAG: hypothetical protein M1828_006207 [Chrysothrix sp. TS-e1954]
MGRIINAASVDLDLDLDPIRTIIWRASSPPSLSSSALPSSLSPRRPRRSVSPGAGPRRARTSKDDSMFRGRERNKASQDEDVPEAGQSTEGQMSTSSTTQQSRGSGSNSRMVDSSDVNNSLTTQRTSPQSSDRLTSANLSAETLTASYVMIGASVSAEHALETRLYRSVTQQQLREVRDVLEGPTPPYSGSRHIPVNDGASLTRDETVHKKRKSPSSSQSESPSPPRRRGRGYRRQIREDSESSEYKEEANVKPPEIEGEPISPTRSNRKPKKMDWCDREGFPRNLCEEE